MATIIDLLENFLGEPLTASVLPLSSRLSGSQIAELIDQLFEFKGGSSDRLSQVEDFAAVDARDIGYPELRKLGSDAYIESIQNRLLYYPRLHVFHEINPFFYALTREPWDTFDEFIKVYIALRGLIVDGILVVSGWPDSERTNPYINELNVLSGNDEELQRFSRNLLATFDTQNYPNHNSLIDEYNITQVVAAEIGANWTAKYSELLKLHEFQLRRTGDALTSFDKIDLRAMDIFSQVHLPAPQRLRAADLVSLRKNEEAFEEWRQNLRSIAKAVLDEECASGKLLSQEFIEQARAKTSVRLADLRALTNSKALKQHFQDATIGFCAGLSAIAQPPVPLTFADGCAALAKPLAGSAMALLMSILFRRPNAKNQVLTRFYSLFEEPTVC